MSLAELGDALYAELSGGGYTSADEDEDFDLADALDELGQGMSTAALARELGVARSTLRGWRAGAKPKTDPGPLVQLGRALRRARDVEGREGELRGQLGNATITGWITVSKDPPRRVTVPAGRLQLDPDVGDDLVDEYLAGAGPGRLGKIFARAVGDKFYRDRLRSGDFRVMTVGGY